MVDQNTCTLQQSNSNFLFCRKLQIPTKPIFFCFRYLKRLQNAAQVFKNWMLEVPSGEPAHLHDDHWGGLRNTPGVGSEGLRVRVDQERGHVLPVPGRAVPEDAEVSDRPPAGVVHRVRYRVLGSQSFWQVSQGFFA